MTPELLTLASGNKIPAIGFGTWQLREGEETFNAVTNAINAGYRLIDTAKIYGNEKSVGMAVTESGISRNDLFVTTKLWHSDLAYDDAINTFEDSYKKLNLAYIDLYLIHWPLGQKRLEAWKALIELKKSGRVKNIGVSNYTIKHLQELMDNYDEMPDVNQIEFHPFIFKGQAETLEFCRKHNILVEAYSPLARGWHMKNKTLVTIAKECNKTVAQVMLRWAIQHGTVPLPKSTSEERIKQNLKVFEFELNDEQMLRIDELGTDEHLVWDPNQID